MATTEARLELDRHPLFRGVDRDELAPILASACITEVERGEILASPGDRRPALILVLGGFLHSYQLTDDGGRVLFEVVGPGGFDAVIPVFDGIGHFTEAGSAAVVATLGKAPVERLLSVPAMARNLAVALADRLSRREHQLAATSLKDPDLRIAKQLLAVADAHGEGDGDAARLRVHLTHQQLADMLGIRRETVTIHLHHLARTGAVVLEPGGLRVSRARLRAILERTLRVPRA